MFTACRCCPRSDEHLPDFGDFSLLLVTLEAALPVMDADSSAPLFPKQPAASPGCVLDKQLPSGWVKLTDDHGVSYYAEPSIRIFQYSHPSLNAPPFAPDCTDYLMGHPSHDSPAWAWMLYLWVREVKSTHSVIGTLCAVSICGRRLCAPPLDKLFQRRVAFRIWFMVSSLISSLFWQVSVKILLLERGDPNFAVEEAISGCNVSARCTLLSIFLQLMFVSVPFGIFRCKTSHGESLQ